jgi:hypothetical protein
MAASGLLIVSALGEFGEFDERAIELRVIKEEPR